MASPKLSRGPVLIAAVCAAVLAGVLPPVFGGQRPPATVIRSVQVPLASLVAGDVRITRAEGGGFRFSDTTRTPTRALCAPIPFETVGLTWKTVHETSRHTGDGLVRAEIFWGPGYDRRVTTVADPDHGPDSGSLERPGLAATDPVWIGESRCLRLRLLIPAGAVIRDLRAIFINTSGTADGPASATSALAGLWRGFAGSFGSHPASAMTDQPAIIPRADWGADESMRNCDPEYADAVRMASVHHTAGTNNYRRHQSDDVIRGIYAYHTQTRGWCDIGYNFVVDRFGRVFEGRYGGIDQPVIGAHAQGFNTGSTGISVMGNFESSKPSTASIDALSQLLAWRLDVAHVSPVGWATMDSGGGNGARLRTISGHRDTGNTACPGRWLYAELERLRSTAKDIGLPKIWKPRQTPFQIEAGGEEVSWRAKLSGELIWTIEVTNESGLRVERFTGAGDVIRQTWDTRRQGVPIAAGTYTVTVSATSVLGVARDAVFTLVVGPLAAPSPSPSPSASPSASPKG